MNIYSIRDFLRQWFSKKGIPECPEFPAALSDGWHHPDVLLTMLRKEPISFCIFQTLSEKSFCNVMPLKNSPGLVWLVKPFDVQFLEILSDFLTEWQQALYQGDSGQRFVLAALSPETGEFSERGCVYKIIFNGVDCGECRVFSAMLDERLKDAVGVVSIDVGKILKCISASSISDEPDWLDKIKLSSFSAFHAFPAPRYLANRSSEFLIHEIERIKTKTEYSDFEKLNSIIMLYNSSRGTFFECQKLRGHFCDALRSIIKFVQKIDEVGVSKAGKKS